MVTLEIKLSCKREFIHKLESFFGRNAILTEKEVFFEYPNPNPIIAYHMSRRRFTKYLRHMNKKDFMHMLEYIIEKYDEKKHNLKKD